MNAFAREYTQHVVTFPDPLPVEVRRPPFQCWVVSQQPLDVATGTSQGHIKYMTQT